jgi:hypothetical protein
MSTALAYACFHFYRQQRQLLTIDSSNTEVDQFASQEGIPQGMDNTINKEVDQEVNKFV